MEQRRLQATRLFAKGRCPAEVARELGVSRQSATVWHHAWEAEGVAGLRQAERVGRLPLQFLAEQRHWLEVKRLPAYAPELNPVEGFWSNLKGQELANRCESHVQMVKLAARLGANRVRSQRSLLVGFLRHTGLAL